MATSFRATAKLEILKQHRCVGCSALFRYPMERSGSAQAATEAAAREGAGRVLMGLLTATFDAHPCPSCGIYQPEMVAKLRSEVVGFISFFAHLAPMVLALLAALDVVLWHQAAWGAGAAALVALGLHLRSATLKPNLDLAGNRGRADREVQAGKLFIDQGGSPDPAVRPGLGELDPGRKLLLGLFALGVVALSSAELLRLGRGWPLNPKWTPGVIGPGDAAVLYFPESITSVAGHWSGEGAAAVLAPAEPAVLRVTSKQRDWGGTIRAKKSESNTSNTPWARVEFEDRAELAGRVLPVRVELNLRYPQAVSGKFANQTRTIASESEVRLAPARAGATYRQLLWGGLCGGSVLLAILGILLVKRRDPLGEASEMALFAKPD